MAAQDPNPGPWDDSMADGCSGVLDLGFLEPCNRHDERYHFGGTVEEKLIADGEFYAGMCAVKGIWGWYARHGGARIRYSGVRFTTYNYPPQHPQRSSGNFIEAWNWLGPGLPKSSQI